jgi:hypothetical protein
MKEEKSNEMSLLDLIQIFFAWLSRCLINILKVLGFLLKLWYRNYITFLVVLFISIALALFSTRKEVLYYNADAMVVLNGSNSQLTKEVCKQIERSFTSEKSISFGEKLHIPDSISHNIIGFKSYYMIDYKKDSIPDVVDFKDNHSLKDTVNIRQYNRLYFRLITKNINQIPIVQNAILNYLNSNPILHAEFKSKRENLIESIRMCNIQIQRIDSMSKINYFKEENNQVYVEDRGVVMGGRLGKHLYFKDLVYIEKVKAKFQSQLDCCNQAVEIPTGFIVDSKPVNGKVKYIIYALFISLGISSVVSLLIENKNKIKNYLNK